MKRYALLIVVLGLLLGLPLAAQESPNLESGLKPYGTFHGGDLDSIGLFNGNLAVHIPLSSYPQRGKLPLDYFLVGNTKNWAAGCRSSRGKQQSLTFRRT